MIDFAISQEKLKNKFVSIQTLFNHYNRLRTEVKESLKPASKGKGKEKKGVADQSQTTQKGKEKDVSNELEVDEMDVDGSRTLVIFSTPSYCDFWAYSAGCAKRQLHEDAGGVLSTFAYGPELLLLSAGAHL